jgi:hypothetical protein
MHSIFYPVPGSRSPLKLVFQGAQNCIQTSLNFNTIHTLLSRSSDFNQTRNLDLTAVKDAFYLVRSAQ